MMNCKWRAMEMILIGTILGNTKEAQEAYNQVIEKLVKSKSDSVRQDNIKKEIKSGRDPLQAVAIAYSVQREAKKKASKKK